MRVKRFVDTNIWFYAFTSSRTADEQKKRQCAVDLLCPGSRFNISAQVLNELSINLIKKANYGEEALKALIRSFYENHHVVDLSQSVLLTASGIRQRYSLSFWDSLIVSAALESGCSSLYSEDMQHHQKIDEGLTIINPFKE